MIFVFNLAPDDTQQLLRIKMADTLKFGPEWLRALSDGTNVASPPPSPAVGMPMYKLAEHRYGREEMLALCHPSREPPEEFKEFHGLLTDKLLQPLALIPLSDEEQRLMSQSVNSTVVLRMMGRGSSGPPTRGGRGGVPDRGRGRGRGRGEGYYPRGPFEEEPGTYARGRVPRDAWEDGRGGRFDRSFPPGRTFEDEVTSPPRREFSRSMSTENWRDTKKEEGEEETGGDWRKAPNRDRWGGTRSWREPRENYGREGYERGGKYDDYRDRPPYERGRFQRTLSTGSWDDTGEYDVPEWSTADVDDMESVGTFDSSGAFMSMKDKNGVEYGMLESSSRPRSDSKEEPGKEKDPDKLHSSDSGSKQVDKPSATKVESDILESKVDPSSQERERGKNSASSNSTASKRSGEKDVGKFNGKSSEPKAAVQNELQQVISADKKQSEQTVANKVSKVNSDSGTVTPSVNSVVTKEVKPPPCSETVNTGRNPLEKANKQEEDANFDHLEKAAENLVATLGAEEETPLEKAGISQIQQHDALASEALPLDHEDTKKWFYRDPQGDLQGPFTSAEMAEWFSAGYFTMNLLVKRGCDERFQGLGDLIKSWGRIPFLPGTSPPPLKNLQNTGSKSSSSSAQMAQVSSAGVAASVAPGVATLPTQSTPLSQAGLPVSSLPGIAAVSIPGMPSGPMPSMPAVSVPTMPPMSLPGMAMSGVPAGTIPNPADIQNPEALKAIQQQILLQQQMVHQHMMRQLQLQQIVQQLQVQPEFASLSAAQQQQHALKLMLQQQMIMQQQQQVQLPVQQAQTAQTQQQQQQAKLSPNTSSKAEGLHRSMSVSQPVNKEAPGFQRSLSQPGKEELPESIWGIPAENAVAQGTAWKAQARSVWDIEAKQVQQWSDKDRESAEKALQEQVKQEERLREEQKREELRRQAEEKARRREQEELEKCQEAERLKAIERQRELERRQELERQRLEQLAMEQEELRRLQEEEEVKRQLEEQKRLEQQRRREEERRRLEQERILEEQRRIQEEERLKKEMEEKIRQDEMRRRQEKFDELRRQQQQEALRRMKQEQLTIQLPASAQWANSTSGATTLPTGGAGTPTGTLSLTQIQQLEAERERKDQEELRQLEIHRQQVAAIQQQQQQLQGRSWASAAHSNIPVSAGAPSLLEIQQEQARQQNDGGTSSSIQKQPQPKAAVPLISAGVWGSGSTSQSQGWAQEGAWGNPKTKASLGFWDEALSSAPVPPKVTKGQDKKGSVNNNSHFPTLGTPQTTNGGRVTAKVKKSNKDEETVQRLFQALKPKDEFTQWCQNALKGMQTSVDIPTFVAFLTEVESPYEVHDYVRSYLGESRDAIEFGSQFLEKRSKYKTQLRQQQQPEDDIWGPAPAVNPNHGRVQAQNQNNNLINPDDSKLSKRKKKKMQKVDQSFLGFTVHAAPDRVNIGSIDSTVAE